MLLDGLPLLLAPTLGAGAEGALVTAVTGALSGEVATVLAGVVGGASAIHGIMSVAIEATPSPNLGPTEPQHTTDTHVTRDAEQLGDRAATRDLPELKADRAQIERKYKHASDFGVESPRGAAGFEEFENSLKSFTADSETVRKLGTYRGNEVILNYNPESGLIVIQNLKGQLISGWKMLPEQLTNVITRGSL